MSVMPRWKREAVAAVRMEESVNNRRRSGLAECGGSAKYEDRSGCRNNPIQSNIPGYRWQKHRYLARTIITSHTPPFDEQHTFNLSNTRYNLIYAMNFPRRAVSLHQLESKCSTSLCVGIWALRNSSELAGYEVPRSSSVL